MSSIKFLLDECVESALAKWLRDKQFDVLYLNETAIRLKDPEILEMAFKEKRILVTCDKDFGDIVFLNKKQHNGIILLRFKYTTALQLKINMFVKLLGEHQAEIEGNFIIATETTVRIVKP
jgi:predicted nuclease of predicted toxin-antitoxin system